MDWNQLEHAYGPATDLPALFERVREGSAAAVDVLGNRIAHQGWVSPEAAMASLPFLVELADATSGKTRAAVLVLLADLACAGSHRHFLGSRVDTEGGAAQFLRAAPVASLRAGVVEAASAASRFLADKSAPVRGAAALLLAVTGQDPAPLHARLATEKNAQARMDLLVALGWLQAAPELLARDMDHTDAGVRAAACLGRSYCGGLDEPTYQGLLAALTLEQVKGSAWAGGDVGQHAALALQWAAVSAGDISRLAEALDVVDEHQRSGFGAAIVKRAFASEIAALGSGTAAVAAMEPPPVASLSAAQRDALTLLARYDSGWGGGDQRFWLKKLGFRSSPPAIRRYLGLETTAPSALTREVRWRDATMPLSAVLAAACVPDEAELTAEAARVVSSQLSPADALTVVREVNQYGDVRSFFARYAFGLQLLLAQGSAIAPVLTDGLSSLARDGNPNFWDDSDYLCIDAHLASQCVAALHHVAAGTPIPAGALDDTAQDSVEIILSQSSPEVAALVTAGLAAAATQTTRSA